MPPITAVLANPVLERPALRILLDIELTTGTLHVSTEDIYPNDIRVAPFYERRLLQEPQFKLALTDTLAGFQRQDDISFVLSTPFVSVSEDPALSALFRTDIEQRGVAVRAHLWNKPWMPDQSAELNVNVFVGKLSAINAGLHEVSLSATSLDTSKLLTKIPVSLVTVDDYPNIPKEGDVGAAIPLGWGIGRSIPARYASAWAPGSMEHYDYVLGSGNLGISKVYREGRWLASPLFPDSDGNPDYERLYRTYTDRLGRYVTAIRFRNFQEGTPIVADVKRIYNEVNNQVVAEWKWVLGFVDDVGGWDAIAGQTVSPASNITTASLVADQTGVDLGAVLLNGTMDYLEAALAIPGNFAALGPVLTLEGWFYPQGGTADWVVGPDMDRATPRYSWYLNWSSTLGWRFTWWDAVSSSYKTTPTTVAPPSPNTWTHVAVVADTGGGSTQTVRVYINGQVSATATSAGTIGYGVITPAPLYFGLGHASLTYAKGRLGCVRLSTAARSARDVARSYYLGRRSPIEFLRDVLTEVGETPDETTFVQAALDIDAVDNGAGMTGALKCDGWLTEAPPNAADVETVVNQLAVFRDLRLSRTSTGMIQVIVTKPQTTAQAQFGVGDQYGNIVEFNGRQRASLAEAIKTLQVSYRLRRDPKTGQPGGGRYGDYEERRDHSVLTIGKVGSLVLTFVRDHVTADMLGEWRAKRIKAEDERLQVTVGHEGRLLQPGQVVRLAIPAHGI